MMTKVMTKDALPFIYHVTDVQDNALIQQIADIEHVIQPLDHWHKPAITDTLAQKVNHCGVMLHPKTITINKDEDETTCPYKVVAYCLFSKVFEVVDILRIGTHPQYQRRGLAAALLTTVIDAMARDMTDRIILEVRADNNAAIHLYQKLGFVETHRRRNYYTTNPLKTGVTAGATVLEIGKETGSTLCDAIIMQYTRLN